MERESEVKLYEVVLDERAQEEINTFPTGIRARTYDLLVRMQTFGPNLGFPFTKKLVGTDDIFEVRAKSKEGIGRALYITVVDKKIIVLCAFVKKTQKTPKKEIEKALIRKKEYKNG